MLEVVEFTLRFEILSELSPFEERIVVEFEAIEDAILAWLVPRLADWVLAQVAAGVIRLIDDRATTAARKLFNRLFMIHARFRFLSFAAACPAAFCSVERENMAGVTAPAVREPQDSLKSRLSHGIAAEIERRPPRQVEGSGPVSLIGKRLVGPNATCRPSLARSPAELNVLK